MVVHAETCILASSNTSLAMVAWSSVNTDLFKHMNLYATATRFFLGHKLAQICLYYRAQHTT